MIKAMTEVLRRFSPVFCGVDVDRLVGDRGNSIANKVALRDPLKALLAIWIAEAHEQQASILRIAMDDVAQEIKCYLGLKDHHELCVPRWLEMLGVPENTQAPMASVWRSLRAIVERSSVIDRKHNQNLLVYRLQRKLRCARWVKQHNMLEFKFCCYVEPHMD